MNRPLSGEKATSAVAFCFFVNRLLDAEPWARERLSPFAGEAVELVLAPLPPVRVTIVEGGRKVSVIGLPEGRYEFQMASLSG